MYCQLFFIMKFYDKGNIPLSVSARKLSFRNTRCGMQNDTLIWIVLIYRLKRKDASLAEWLKYLRWQYPHRKYFNHSTNAVPQRAQRPNQRSDSTTQNSTTQRFNNSKINNPTT